MSKTLTEIAKQLKAANKKVQLIYAFNGSGKTRLSREFKQQIAPKNGNDEGDDATQLPRNKILYYNAFTEDLFYWDNDLELDAEPKLKIQPNSFTDWILIEQGQDRNIITNFQRYANDKLTPRFNEEYKTKDKDGNKNTVRPFSEVTFSLERGDNVQSGNIKISKGEESNFIWSVFYALLEQVISILNVPEPGDRETQHFNQLEYVFIDDPVSSLDENNLIELAVNLAGLIKSSQSALKFVVTTHSPLFYNVLFNLLESLEGDTFDLTEKQGDSNTSFSYHLYLKQILERAIIENQVQRYHFTILRNLYEKTASFLGYQKWSELLPDDKQAYLNRIIQFTSHSKLSNETVAVPSEQEKNTVGLLLNHLVENYGFWRQGQQHG
jgi:hypothetical protein